MLQYEMFVFVKCRHCGRDVAEDDAFVVEKNNGKEVIEYIFCNEAHASEFYLERLRASGM